VTKRDRRRRHRDSSSRVACLTLKSSLSKPTEPEMIRKSAKWAARVACAASFALLLAIVWDCPYYASGEGILFPNPTDLFVAARVCVILATVTCCCAVVVFLASLGAVRTRRVA